MVRGYHRRYQQGGHLFQGRFTSILVEKNAHLLELGRYLVLNPVEATIVPHPRQWACNNSRATVGETRAPAYLKMDWILGDFDKRERPAEECP